MKEQKDLWRFAKETATKRYEDVITACNVGDRDLLKSLLTTSLATDDELVAFDKKVKDVIIDDDRFMYRGVEFDIAELTYGDGRRFDMSQVVAVAHDMDWVCDDGHKTPLWPLPDGWLYGTYPSGTKVPKEMLKACDRFIEDLSYEEYKHWRKPEGEKNDENQ